jgi:MoaA/NifB/PqqE/SkfB family radical SAM enzyme
MKTKASNYGSFKNSIQAFGLRKAFEYIESNPEKNLGRLVEIIKKFDIGNTLKTQTDVVTKALQDKGNNWNQLFLKFLKDIHPNVRTKALNNVIINASIYGKKRQRELEKELDCNIPWAILMDPTSACNLHCTGCWAADYGNKLNLTIEEWDDIINQGKEMGIFAFIYSGGEPLVRKKDIIKMCEKHDDCMFLSFTNGTLIDEKFADEMARVGNFVPAISIEGYAEETDFRRGDGCYDAVMKAMKILKERNLLFGISCCYTSKNTHIVGSEAYIDDMIEKGAMFAWFFTYIPVGVDAVTDLIATPEQREFMYHQVRKFRETKPLFTMDFWNDGEYVKGCVAGGRAYLHINANGDVEPCAFIHYSDSNIREKSILQACQSPLFEHYRQGQPFNQNMLQPCPLLDNPDKLVEIVEKSGAHSTDLQNPENVRHLCGKCQNASQKWTHTANKLWKTSLEEKTEKIQEEVYIYS